MALTEPQALTVALALGERSTPEDRDRYRLLLEAAGITNDATLDSLPPQAQLALHVIASGELAVFQGVLAILAVRRVHGVDVGGPAWMLSLTPNAPEVAVA
jgi:hypothetical protein